MARPQHEPTEKTRAEVAALASFGVPHDSISEYMGLAPKTLRKHYREELDNSSIKANANVARFLYQSATGSTLKDGATYADCTRAAMFWAKTRMGWSETSKHEVTGKDGGPIESKDLTERDAEELASRIARLAAAESAGSGTQEADD